MKKTLFTLCTMAVATGAFAQTEAGHILIGGSSNLGFTSGKENNDQDDADSHFGIGLNVGYFLMDNLAAGITLGFSSDKAGGGDGDAYTTLAVGPVVRYYLPMKVFAQVSYAFGSEGQDDKVGTGDLGIGVGYAAFLNDHVAIEPMVAYHLTSAKPDEGDSVSGSNFGLNIGISVYLGD